MRTHHAPVTGLALAILAAWAAAPMQDPITVDPAVTGVNKAWKEERGLADAMDSGQFLRISVNNISNERFYDPIDVTFAANDLISARPFIPTAITDRYRF